MATEYDIRKATNTGLVRAQDYVKTSTSSTGGSIGYALKDSASPQMLTLKSGGQSVPGVIYEALQKHVAAGTVKPDVAIMLSSIVRTESDGSLSCKTSSGKNTYCGLFQVGDQYFNGDECVGEGTGSNFREFVIKKHNLYNGDTSVRLTPEQFNQDIDTQIIYASELMESKKNMVQREILGKNTSPYQDEDTAELYISKSTAAYLGGLNDNAKDSLGTTNGQYGAMGIANFKAITDSMGATVADVVKASKTGTGLNVSKENVDTQALANMGLNKSYASNNPLVTTNKSDGKIVSNTSHQTSTSLPPLTSTAVQIKPTMSNDRINFLMVLVNMTAGASGTSSYVNVELLPEQISENISADFDSVAIPGRSEPFLNYVGNANREISFTLKLYHPYCKQPGGIMATTRALKAMSYPSYQFGYILPPYCFVQMGKLISFYGICSNVGITWQKPIIFDEQEGGYIYAYADVSLSFKQANANPFDYTHMLNHGGNV